VAAVTAISLSLPIIISFETSVEFSLYSILYFPIRNLEMEAKKGGHS
jgi:hypothetical protein